MGIFTKLGSDRKWSISLFWDGHLIVFFWDGQLIVYRGLLLAILLLHHHIVYRCYRIYGPYIKLSDILCLDNMSDLNIQFLLTASMLDDTTDHLGWAAMIMVNATILIFDMLEFLATPVNKAVKVSIASGNRTKIRNTIINPSVVISVSPELTRDYCWPNDSLWVQGGSRDTTTSHNPQTNHSSNSNTVNVRFGSGVMQSSEQSDPAFEKCSQEFNHDSTEGCVL
jgi:hypothetical protein